MYGIAFLVLLPFFGWWLIRTTRSYDQLAQAANENNIELGFLSFKGKTNAFLLLSDVRFVIWLVRRKYEKHEYPEPVVNALDDARRAYFMMHVGFAILILLVLAISLTSFAGKP